MSSRFNSALCVIAICVASVAGLSAADQKLSPEQELKKQVYLLKVENATLRARLADRESRVQALETVFRLQVEGAFAKESQALSEQCKALEVEFREALKPEKAATFNCQTLEFAK